MIHFSFPTSLNVTDLLQLFTANSPGEKSIVYLPLPIRHRLLGGSEYDSILEGPALDPSADLRLTSLYYDAHAPGGTGQIFGAYECRAGEGGSGR